LPHPVPPAAAHAGPTSARVRSRGRGVTTPCDQRQLMEQLAVLPALADCTFTALRKLAARGTQVQLPPGWPLIQETTPGTSCYLVLSGAVSISRNGRTIAEVGP